MPPAPIRAEARHWVDAGVPAPRYHQVYVALRGLIADGTYPPGARLPAEPELCRAFGVSRITVRRAVSELVRLGSLERRQGSGTFVNPPQSGAVRGSDLRELSHRVAGLGATTVACDLRVDWVEADADTCRALELEPRSRVQLSSRVRVRDGLRMGFVKVWLPEDVGRGVIVADLRRATALEVLERAGVEVGSAEQAIGAALASLELAQALGIPVGSAVLRVTRIVRSVDGRPVERVLAQWRADAYEYRMSLRRGPVDAGVWTEE